MRIRPVAAVIPCRKDLAKREDFAHAARKSQAQRFGGRLLDEGQAGLRLRRPAWKVGGNDPLLMVHPDLGDQWYLGVSVSSIALGALLYKSCFNDGCLPARMT